MVSISSLTTLLTYAIGVCGTMPLFPWLTVFPRMALVAGLIVGLWQDYRGRWPLKPWLLNSAVVPFFIYYVLQFSRANPVQPVVSMLAIMLAVRLGGEKNVRHSVQIYALSMFCLASSSLFDLSPVFLLYLGLLLVMGAVALVLLTFQNQDQAMTVSMADLKKIVFSALMMAVLAVPLLLIYFPIMPRTQLPLWQFLTQTPSRTTGYSDIVEPGSHSSIAQSRTLAFRAEIPRQAQSQLYWRGTVFNLTSGIKWTRSTRVPTERPEVSGQTVTQIIYPEPSAARVLITLDRPATLVLPRVRQFPDGVFEYAGAVGKRVSYRVESLTNGMVAQRDPINRAFYTQLPERLPLRVKELAARIKRSASDDDARIEFAESYFRNGGYRYSTSGLATGDTALEQFLFEKKQGHCEFFASSFALLLRAAGIPCRLVGGYLGGEYNQVGGYYLVTDDKAHVWVEAYVEGRGWQRIDPSTFAVNAGEVWTAPASRSIGLRIGMALDSFNHAWNRSVIAYDLEQQITLARNAGVRLQGINPAALLRSSVPYLAAGLLLMAAALAVRRLSLFSSREVRIQQRFCRVVEDKLAIPAVAGGVGLFEIAAAADNRHVSEFVAIYAAAVYRDRRLTDEEYLLLRHLLRIIKSMKPKKT